MRNGACWTGKYIAVSALDGQGTTKQAWKQPFDTRAALPSWSSGSGRHWQTTLAKAEGREPRRCAAYWHNPQGHVRGDHASLFSRGQAEEIFKSKDFLLSKQGVTCSPKSGFQKLLHRVTLCPTVYCQGSSLCLQGI